MKPCMRWFDSIGDYLEVGNLSDDDQPDPPDRCTFCGEWFHDRKWRRCEKCERCKTCCECSLDGAK